MTNEIDAAVLSSRSDELPGWWAFPGPLEGHQRPAAIGGRAMPEAEAAELVEQLGDDPSGPLFSTLAHTAQMFDLSGVLLDRAREMARNVFFSGSLVGREVLLGRLRDGCFLAAAQRDEELAKTIASAAMSAAPHACSAEDVLSIFQCLLLAGAAFENECEWAEWVEDQLVQIAVRLPRGEPARVFLGHLRELKSVIDLTLCIHGRAEAFASAAAGVES